MQMRTLADRTLNLLFPPECAGCRLLTDNPFGLCPACWSATRFISGTICDCCGMPLSTGLPGEAGLCEPCRLHPPAWARGRAAVLYEGAARDILLGFKHRDRLDLSVTLARWIRRAAGDLIDEADLVAPVPLHWTRLMARRANQSGELARKLRPGKGFSPALLERSRRTPSLGGLSRRERQDALSGAIRVTPRYRGAVKGANVLVIDDVLTTGATLSACADALMSAGAGTVNIAVVARVAQEGFAPI